MLKRSFDFTLALLGLILSSPLWLIVSLAIYIEDRGPVLFLQERCGMQGKPFKMLKFRTMRHLPTGKHQILSQEIDPRVTRVGRLLRATALDELPNLINILKGDMSFVGPKPLPFKIEADRKAFIYIAPLTDETMQYDNISQVPGYDLRSRIRPGLTGVAQLYAPKTIDHTERFRYDNLYVQKMSFWLDLKLILLSFLVTFKGKWEHQEKKI